jgi:hypothetical protein
MLEVSHYIHLNPVEARMVKRPEHYPWSSFNYYKNAKLAAPVFMSGKVLLDYYEGELSLKREKYCSSHALEVRDKGPSYNLCFTSREHGWQMMNSYF